MPTHVRATANLHWAGPGWSVAKDIADLEAIVAAGATRIGAQECRREVIVGFLERNPEWSVAFDEDTLDKPAYRVVPMFYRRDLYSCEPRFVTVPIGFLGTAGAGEDRIEHKVIACPAFTDLETGARFRDFNLHQIVSAFNSKVPKAERDRRKAAWMRVNVAVRGVVEASLAEGVPVIGGGDWNATRDQVGPLG